MVKAVLDIVREDHVRIAKLFNQILVTQKNKPKVQREAWEALRRLISLHSLIEEENLYPILKEKTQSKDFIKVAGLQHRIADRLLGDLEKSPIASPSWIKSMRELKDVMVTHMQLEEEELRVVLNVALSTEELSILTAKLKTSRAA